MTIYVSVFRRILFYSTSRLRIYKINNIKINRYLC